MKKEKMTQYDGYTFFTLGYLKTFDMLTFFLPQSLLDLYKESVGSKVTYQRRYAE